MEENETPKKATSGFVKGLFGFVLVAALSAGATAYGVKMYPQVLGLSKGAAEVQKEVDTLLTQVGKLISLPSDEKPTIATVSDAEKVKTQAFFKNAANGDKVLIYTNAKKAILYRPSENKVVEVGAVNINQQAATQPQVSPSPKAEEATQ